MDQKGYGYHTEKEDLYFEEGVQKRTRTTAYGVRIYGLTKGKVSEYSIVNSVL